MDGHVLLYNLQRLHGKVQIRVSYPELSLKLGLWNPEINFNDPESSHWKISV